MEIFLTSQASKVLSDICNNLRKRPQEYPVAFVTTASNPYEDAWWMREDREKLVELGFRVSDVDIAGKTLDQLEKEFADVNIIFVAGGNTFYLLEKTKESGFDKLIKEMSKKDIIYIGSSAGSVILAPDIEPSKYFDEREGTNLENTEGLGLIDFVPLPHYGNEKSKELNDKVLAEYGGWKYKIVPMTDTQYRYVKENDIRLYDVSKPQR